MLSVYDDGASVYVCVCLCNIRRKKFNLFSTKKKEAYENCGKTALNCKTCLMRKTCLLPYLPVLDFFISWWSFGAGFFFFFCLFLLWLLSGVITVSWCCYRFFAHLTFFYYRKINIRVRLLWREECERERDR